VPHVFISHASENSEEANELVALLESKGVTAWIAPRDVRPGFDYSIELQSAIEGCVAFVVLITEMANDSPYVRAETEMAFSNSKPILPVRLAQIAPGPGLAFFLKIRNWTEAWGPKRDASLARLLLELQTLTGTAPSWAPRVAPATAEAPSAPPSPPPAPAPVPPPPLASPGSTRPARPLLPWLIFGAIALAMTLGIFLFARRSPQAPAPGPNINTVTPAPTPAPPPSPPPSPPPTRNYADELTDFGVQPKSELETNVGSATPLVIPVGNRIATEEVARMIANNQVTAVDVLSNAHPQTLPAALYMPAGGMPGSFFDASQAQFVQQLGEATGGDTSRPLVFFCQGANCWESYNAALRANAAGYTRIYWYRGGLAAWQEAGLAMMPLPATYSGSGAAKPEQAAD
jgi:PQQ-dependent catabolism-associated CXXCW motif protein